MWKQLLRNRRWFRGLPLGKQEAGQKTGLDEIDIFQWVTSVVPKIKPPLRTNYARAAISGSKSGQW
jgi:hypothetical protein